PTWSPTPPSRRPAPPTRRMAVAVGAVAVAGLVAGCSGGGSKPRAARATSSTMPVADTSTTMVDEATTSPVPTSAAATTAVKTAAVERCHTSQLSATPGPTGAALGHVGLVVVLKNRSSARCRILGYPGLQRLDAARRPVPTDLRRGTSYMFVDPGPAIVDLAPGATASFALGWTHVPTGDDTGPCPTSPLAAVTPPDETDPLVVAIDIDVCDPFTLATSAVVTGPNGPKAG
ncbi:MAG: DUF4232 domain-containing protein, partial [Acidimicrobiales bacterium]